MNENGGFEALCTKYSTHTDSKTRVQAGFRHPSSSIRQILKTTVVWRNGSGRQKWILIETLRDRRVQAGDASWGVRE